MHYQLRTTRSLEVHETTPASERAGPPEGRSCPTCAEKPFGDFVRKHFRSESQITIARTTTISWITFGPPQLRTSLRVKEVFDRLEKFGAADVAGIPVVPSMSKPALSDGVLHQRGRQWPLTVFRAWPTTG